MSNRLVCLIIVAVLGTICGCSTSMAVEKNSNAVELLASGCNTELSELEVVELLAMDFCPGIGQCEFISPFDEGGEKYGAWLPSSIKQCALSEGEGRLMGMTFTPPDGRREIAETLGYVSRFYRSNNRMPVSGAELFPFALTRTGYDDLLAMEPGEQYHHLYAGVNPVTGRFFGDFGDPAWRPGGMYFETIKDEDFILERYSSHFSPEHGLPVVMRVKVFGECPDSLLIDEYVATNCHQRTKPIPRQGKTMVIEK